jgi:hypothetical protein
MPPPHSQKHSHSSRRSSNPLPNRLRRARGPPALFLVLQLGLVAAVVVPVVQAALRLRPLQPRRRLRFARLQRARPGLVCHAPRPRNRQTHTPLTCPTSSSLKWLGKEDLAK